jgi:hypothetical protein
LKGLVYVDNTDNEKQPVALSLGSKRAGRPAEQGCFFLYYFKKQKEGNTRHYAEVMKDEFAEK